MNLLYRLTLATIALLLLAGCGNANVATDGQLQTLSHIPIPAELTLYNGAQEATFDTLILATKQAFQTQAPKSVESQLYWVPETVTWEHIEQFYAEAFASSDWRVEEAIVFNTTTWTRNSAAGQQVLVISTVPLAESDAHILVMFLVSR